MGDIQPRHKGRGKCHNRRGNGGNISDGNKQNKTNVKSGSTIDRISGEILRRVLDAFDCCSENESNGISQGTKKNDDN